jgi:hypothetical protein
LKRFISGCTASSGSSNDDGLITMEQSQLHKKFANDK